MDPPNAMLLPPTKDQIFQKKIDIMMNENIRNTDLD